ncbi:unnamed protein product [Hermetia illucens]|uniref:LYR motif-containing protein 2 n=1 Tax=Hermetia illucens TaxID=343691 RepID=A0A7R8UWA5_HERIL|nr:LYR motif-containing protein 2 [Hermetia illucens]CAD7088305.1 unnamed protein product [Hermetia illucens]
MSRIPKQALSLKQFMLRQEVLKLYREIFRCIRQVPDAATRAELKSWARHDFRANQHQSDESAIKILIGHGRKSLTELRNSLALSGSGSAGNKK